MDVMTKEQRHKTMSHIRAKDTSVEKMIRTALHKAGFRYRLYDKRYLGTPDLVLPKYYAVIFINGCFWHAHENCRYFVFPKSNPEFWDRKFTRNKERDLENIKYYQEKCWRICIVWECAIRGRNSKQKIDEVKDQIIQWLDETTEPLLEIRGTKS